LNTNYPVSKDFLLQCPDTRACGAPLLKMSRLLGLCIEFNWNGGGRREINICLSLCSKPGSGPMHCIICNAGLKV
jgi:hypothetical protein